MDKVTKQDILKLAKPQKNYVVSIYLPTEKAVGADVRQNQIRFKNLLNRARHDLGQLGVRDHTIEKQLQPAKKLLVDEDFWRHQSDGLAVFFSEKNARIYRLPISFVETCTVAKRYHLKQLLQTLNNNKSYHILALSPNNVRLFKATPTSIQAAEDNGLPENITEALGVDDNERQTQHHFGDSTATAEGGTIYHGHGGAKDLHAIDLERFVRNIAGAVGKKLKKSPAPLVVAGVDEMVALYKQISSHNNLHDKHLRGNFDETEPHRLHEQLLELLRPEMTDDTTQILQRYHELTNGRSELATDNLTDVIDSAYQGRIETILVNKQTTCWGEVADNLIVSHQHEQQPGLVDLSDIAAVLAFKSRSDVHLVEPEAITNPLTPALAIMRY